MRAFLLSALLLPSCHLIGFLDTVHLSGPTGPCIQCAILSGVPDASGGPRDGSPHKVLMGFCLFVWLVGFKYEFSGWMAHQLRTPVFFQRTQVQVPAPTWQLTTAWNSSPRGCNALFCPLQVLHLPSALTCMQANIHPYQKEKRFRNFKEF